MENKLNYESVPSGYLHCFNKQCVQSKKCMRYLVAEHCTTVHLAIRIVNPTCIPKDTDACPHFHPIQKLRKAWGISHLYDNLPHKDVAEIRSRIIARFGRTAYYRIYRKERGLLPEDQQYIQTVFRHNGIKEEPVYESYTEEYQWQ